VVSAHGCAMRSPIKLEVGVPLQFQLTDGRLATAHVVDCQPIGPGDPSWRLAAKLDRPENIWGLRPCPEDWTRLMDLPAVEPPAAVPDTNRPSVPRMPMLRALVAEQVEPLYAELADLREKLIQQKHKNRFEVSLSHIPPEVEEKLWMRLREDLGAQALRQTREQAENVLRAAQSAIELKITEAQEEFRHWVQEQRQVLEQQLQGLSEKTGDDLRQYLRAAAEEFQQQASTMGERLERQSEESLQSVLRHLGEEREAHRRELETVQVAAAAESSRLQVQLSDLGRRMAELDESAHRMESGLNTRLMRMSGEIVSGARAQLESAVDSLFQNLAARNAKDLGHQLEEAAARLQNIQSEIEASVSESMKANVSQTLQSFEKTVDDSARRSVERWRLSLARDLDSVAEMLGGHSRSRAEAGDNEEH